MQFYLVLIFGILAEADGNRTRRGTLVPPLVLKTREPTRRSVASTSELTASDGDTLCNRQLSEWLL